MHLKRNILSERFTKSNATLINILGGNDDRPLSSDSVVPFESPASLRADFILPHRGKISGMLVPKGVTVITGMHLYFLTSCTMQRLSYRQLQIL